jgi:biofilm PGA synthesis N-glycosyltransferase PgaC
MSPLLILLFVVACIFLGVPVAYFLSMKHVASKPWRVKINRIYTPTVSILVPLHNEKRVVDLKLRNLCKVDYPRAKMQVIFVDDASDDETAEVLANALNSVTNLNVKVLHTVNRIGKSKALNFALEHATGEVVVVSDADCFWPLNILRLALPYLADSNVGAITGREILLNPEKSWVTKGEVSYNSLVQAIRLGESKLYSTIIFQGGFAAYKRSCLNEFDHETDDSGTALNIVQSRRRTLIIPEIFFYTIFPSSWKSKFQIKIRRATQLMLLWTRCSRLQLKGKLLLPKRIFLPETFLHMVNPILFILVVSVFSLCSFLNPLVLTVLLLLAPICLISKGRELLVEIIQSNVILLVALVAFASNRRFELWKIEEESRSLLKTEMLRDKDLI